MYNKEDTDQDTREEYSFSNELYSWLKFNERVINEARRSVNPIMERLKFIGIADNNLDEFIRTKLKFKKDLRKAIIRQTHDIENTYNSLKEELSNNGIYIVDMDTLKRDNTKGYNFIKKEFIKNIYPLLQPLIVRNELPIPDIEDGGSFLLSKISNDSDDKEITGIIRIPDTYLIKVESDKKDMYISSDEVIKEFAHNCYYGKNIIWSKIFRVFRKVESLNISIDTNYIDGIRNQLYDRKRAEIMMVDVDSPIEGLSEITDCSKRRIREYPGGLSYLIDVTSVINYKNSMIFPKARPRIVVPFVKDSSIFDIISQSDRMVHFPYESFDLSTTRFLQEAAADPDVLVIKQTLYRVSKNSKMTEALINAAKSGKQVIVLLELKAKMDEWNNLNLAEELQSVGCQVIFGPIEMKIHAKTTLVVRREGNKLAKYVNISTGNFNDKTAKLYEDISYFAKDRNKYRIGTDICHLFTYLGGFSNIRPTNEVLISPMNFRSKFIEEIDKCIENTGSITMKCNAFTDEVMAKKIYDASRNGVKVRLIIRGMCILKPINSNIEIISIVGRYLEHSRIYEFNYDDTRHVYIGSGDMMPRNLDKRVEVLIPIKNKSHIEELHELLENYFKDNTNKYVMTMNKENEVSYDEPKDELTDDSFSIQGSLIDRFKNAEKSVLK